MSILYLINIFYGLPTSLTDILNRDNSVTYSKLGPPFKKKKQPVDVYLVNQVKKRPFVYKDIQRNSLSSIDNRLFKKLLKLIYFKRYTGIQ